MDIQTVRTTKNQSTISILCRISWEETERSVLFTIIFTPT